VGITAFFGCATLAGLINKPLGYLGMLSALGLIIWSVVQRETRTAPPPQADVYAELDANVEVQNSAQISVHNDGPGAVHDVQVSAMDNAGKVMTFDLIPHIREGKSEKPRFTILDRNARRNEQYTSLLSFLDENLVPRNMTRMMEDLKSGHGLSSMGMFEDVPIPFTVTFRQDGHAGARVRRHKLIYQPNTRRAFVRVLD